METRKNISIEKGVSLAQKYVWKIMNAGLNPRLWYHNLHHTWNDVMPAAISIAEGEKIVREELLLLLTGVLFHDIGYIERYQENEEIAVRIAEKILPGFGFTRKQTATISGIILATRFPQKPQTFLEEIMCDADLHSLGRSDFLTLSKKLYREHIQLLSYIPFRNWLERQLYLLKSHTYFTRTARLQQHKEQNMRILESLLAKQSSITPEQV